MQKPLTNSVNLDAGRHEEKREQLRQDAIAAWNHYQATGLHVTADEADVWLEKLEKGENPPAPALRNARMGQ